MKRTPIAVAVAAALFLGAGIANAAGETGKAGGSATDEGGMQQGAVDKSFMELDTNLDGLLSKDEAVQSQVLGGEFEIVDINRDGYIDHSEFSAFEEAGFGEPNSTPPSDQRPMDESSRRAPSGSAYSGAAGGMGTDSSEADSGRAGAARGDAGTADVTPPVTVSFSSLDTDADNRLSKKEAAADPDLEKQFTTVDSDGNGVIEESEFAAFQINESGGTTEPKSPDMGGGSSAVERDPNYRHAILRIAQAGTGSGSVGGGTLGGGTTGGATDGGTLDGSGALGGGAGGTTTDDPGATGSADGTTAGRPTTSLPSFTALDLNGDAVISQDEASASATLLGSFTQADTNRDGMIDRAEFSALEAGGTDTTGGTTGTYPGTTPGGTTDNGSTGLGNVPPAGSSVPSGKP